MGIFNRSKKENKTEKPSQNKQGKKFFLEHESDEDTNPKIKLYNEFVRHAFSYNTEFFSTCGIDAQEIRRIFEYVINDYPEMFWVSGYRLSGNSMAVAYRCVNEDGQIDVKDIERKKAELRKNAKYFTRGITKKTKPYDALITIYRRLILELDYDGVGLRTEERRGGEDDYTTDDNLRSLYSALVHRKVVCAGYAVALQYLLQSVGISCACVSSERYNNSGHAFNALKIGKYVYYVDATWGDRSNTLTGKKEAGDIFYDYCCVPYKEFLLTSEESKAYHTPDKEFYPGLEEFKDTNHEYFRFRKAYLVRYDENIMANVFAQTAKVYNPKEMGNFSIGFRCHDKALMNYIVGQITNGSTMNRIVNKAKAICGKKSKASKLFTNTFQIKPNPATAVFYISFKQQDAK